jgi:cytochrome P450
MSLRNQTRQEDRATSHFDFYELPRIHLHGPPWFPAVEYLRWVCEARKLTYVEHPEQMSHPLRADQVRLVASEGAFEGVLASLEFLDRRSRESERVFGDSQERCVSNHERVLKYLLGLSQPSIRLWLFHLQNSPDVLAPLLSATSSSSTSPSCAMHFNKGESINPVNELAAIEKTLVEVESELAQKGTPFLAGNAPGVEDIMLSALAYLLVLPTNAGVTLPNRLSLPPALQELVDQTQQRPAGQLIVAVYEQTRPKRQPTLPLPTYGPTWLERILNPKVVRMGAQVLLKWVPRIQLGNRLIVSDWHHVSEVLEKDNDFLIAPVNGQRIRDVGGPFILGMDRSPELVEQREHVYSAMKDADRSSFKRILTEEPGRLLDSAIQAGGRIDVVNGYARLIAGRTAAAFFGIFGPTEQDLLRVIRSIFHETFLNQGRDLEVQRRGIAAGLEIRDWIQSEQSRRREQQEFGRDVLGRLMASTEGDNDLARYMLGGLQVGAVDTTATVVANIIAEVVADRHLKSAMMEDIQHPERFRGWCWEALRRRPHNAGMLRQAGSNAVLRGIPVPEGTQILLLTVGAMHDPSAFDNPNHLRPDRPLDRYLHFGRGLHQCSGRDLNAIQVPILVRELLLRDVSSHSSPKSLGPFPDELIVNIRAPR